VYSRILFRYKNRDNFSDPDTIFFKQNGQELTELQTKELESTNLAKGFLKTD